LLVEIRQDVRQAKLWELSDKIRDRLAGWRASGRRQERQHLVLEMKEWITGRNPVYECLPRWTQAFFQAAYRQRVDEKGRISGDHRPG